MSVMQSSVMLPLAGLSKKRRVFIVGLALLLTMTSLIQGGIFPIPESSFQSAFAGREGTFVLIDCASQSNCTFHPQTAAKPLPPCSTFKIWNTLIGLESGLISSPDEPFYQWDGEERSIPDWNRNLTLKEAFQVSCVPAYQNLARRIGAESMRSWLEKIDYGDRNLSAGTDVFWLPAPGRKTILISPNQQAELIRKLATGKLPFSATSQAVLKSIMVVKRTDRGVLYGKTGSGGDGSGKYNLGWFVGYVECRGQVFVFACVVMGEDTMGKDARVIVESVLKGSGHL
jgi:beta-lactamase class D